MNGHTLVGEGAHKVIGLHGWLGDSRIFEPVWPFLNRDAFTYAFMDYRGYGQSASLAGEYTLAEIAADVLALADGLGWDRFSVIGHSMGGMAIQWLAALAPERLIGMTGITPVPASGFPMDAETEALFRGAKTDAACRQAILMHTTGNRLTPAFGRVMTERSFAQTTPDAVDAYLTAWSQTDFSDRVKGLSVPFQVLVGAHDPAVTELLMRDTIAQWFPNADVTVIPNAGHYPMLETPLALVSLWEAFLAQHVPVGAA
jgi:pimeloyl-ACP methyl ester carboxylesterase